VKLSLAERLLADLRAVGGPHAPVWEPKATNKRKKTKKTKKGKGPKERCP
jgi:hypothetical protein